MHAVGAGHDQRVFRPFGHLIADENLPQEPFLGALGLGNQFDAGGVAVRHGGLVVGSDRNDDAVYPKSSCAARSVPRPLEPRKRRARMPNLHLPVSDICFTWELTTCPPPVEFTFPF